MGQGSTCPRRAVAECPQCAEPIAALCHGQLHMLLETASGYAHSCDQPVCTEAGWQGWAAPAPNSQERSAMLYALQVPTTCPLQLPEMWRPAKSLLCPRKSPPEFNSLLMAGGAVCGSRDSAVDPNPLTMIQSLVPIPAGFRRKPGKFCPCLLTQIIVVG